MISDLFFYRRLTNDYKIIFEEDFVVFYLKIRLQNNKFNLWIVSELLDELYGIGHIKNKQILPFCKRYFNYKDKEFFITFSEEEKELYERTIEYSKEIKSIQDSVHNNFNEILKKEVLDPEISFENKLKKFILYYQNKTNLGLAERIVVLYKYFNIIKNYYQIYRIIDTKLQKIYELYDVLKITDLYFNKQQIDFLASNNIFNLKNLKHMPVDSLICIFSNDIEKFIEEISKYVLTKEDIIDKINDLYNSVLKSDQNKVLEKRFSFNKNEKSTLEDLGKELCITRERVRQIEKRAILILLKNREEINKLLIILYQNAKKDSNYFITLKNFADYIDNDRVTRCLMIIASYNTSRVIFNNEYGIFYNKAEFSFEEILKQSQIELEDIIPISNTKKYNKIQQKMLETQYKKYQDKVFLKKGVNVSEIYLKELRENFINGYDIGNEDDYNKFKQIIVKKYEISEIPSMHSIQALIDRSDLVQVDRGTYKAKEYAVNLSEDLLPEIISYIIENAPVVPYNSIFEKFREKLENLGVNNKYYLKGLLDRELPKKFTTNRDFISTSAEENIRIYDVLINIFKNFEAEFTIEEVKEKMPGLEMYSYENYAKSEEKNGLINIGEKTYIYVDKLNISKETQIELKEFIDNLFEKMNSKTISAKKIYTNLSIRNKELLDKLHITAKFGDFELFSIIKYLFKDNYYYSRPLICLEENETITTYTLIKEYVRKMEQFNYNNIKEYIFKMNLRTLYSYMNFMEDLSDEYIQVDKDAMVKIEKLEIPQGKLEKIKEFIDLILRSRELRTDNFDGYFMLPKLDRPWNKYMLIGIIRTYFKDEFEIENTTNSYDTTDFIVRRIK